MSLSLEQIERVQYLLDGDWGGQAPSDKLPEYWTKFDSVLSSVASPEELHAFVDRWNWDGGTIPIKKALAHPLCDRGTLLMVYWRIDPIFYLKQEHATREKVKAKLWPDALVHWDMLRQIEERMATGAFASARIAYDPTNDRGRDRTKQRPPKNIGKPIFEHESGTFQVVGRREVEMEPEIDVHGKIPAIMFQPVL